MMWNAVSVAIAFGWLLNVELMLCVFFLSFLPFRARRSLGYIIAILIFLCVIDWQRNNPIFVPELIVTESLIANLSMMYAFKAFFIRARSRLGRAMAINNYTLSIFFIVAQLWSLWDGGDIETRVHYVAYAALLWTVNLVITELLAPANETEESRSRRTQI